MKELLNPELPMCRYFDVTRYEPAAGPNRLVIYREAERQREENDLLDLTGDDWPLEKVWYWKEKFRCLNERRGVWNPAHFAVEIPEPVWWQNMSPARRLNFKFDSLYGTLRVTQLSEEGIEGIAENGATIFLPVQPTQEELAAAFVEALGKLPDDKARRKFAESHLDQYTGGGKQFTQNLHLIVKTKFPLVEGLHATRKFLVTWLKELDEVYGFNYQDTDNAEEVGNNSDQARIPKRNRAKQRPAAIALYCRLKSGEHPAIEDGKKKETLNAIARQNNLNKVNFFNAFNDITNDKDRLTNPEHLKLAIDLLSEFPKAQELVRTDWEQSTAKK